MKIVTASESENESLDWRGICVLESFVSCPVKHCLLAVIRCSFRSNKSSKLQLISAKCQDRGFPHPLDHFSNHFSCSLHFLTSQPEVFFNIWMHFHEVPPFVASLTHPYVERRGSSFCLLAPGSHPFAIFLLLCMTRTWKAREKFFFSFGRQSRPLSPLPLFLAPTWTNFSTWHDFFPPNIPSHPLPSPVF